MGKKKRAAFMPTTKYCPEGEHDWKYEDDEYGSLGSGGSYEVYRCSKCQKRTYVPLPD